MKVFIKICNTTLLVILILISLSSFGQTNTFKILTDIGTRHDHAYSIAIQNDGKVIVAGDADGRPCIIRYDTIGALDNTFGNGGIVLASWTCGFGPADNGIEILADGKIVLGTSIHNGDNQDFVVARYRIDGTPDELFGTNGKVITSIGNYNDRCNAIAIQSDGKIVAAGGTNNSPASNYNYDFALVRYNTNGSIDSTFGTNGITKKNIGLSNNIAYSIAVQHDDKIILAGEANDSIFSDFALVRYNPDGELDNTFGNSGVVRTGLSETYDYAKSVVMQSDGKILVAGSAQNGLSNNYIALVRYNYDGTLDSTFATNGVVFSGSGSAFGNSVSIQKDNKIVLAGTTHTGGKYVFATLQYNMNGSLDNSFGTNGIITTSFDDRDSEGHAVAIGNDGEIIIAGSFNHGSPNYFDFAIVRLFSNLSCQTVPVLSSPLNGATGESTNPTMTWHTAFGAASYNIQVSNSPNFDAQLIYCTGLPSTSFALNGLYSHTVYYWRVSSTSVGGTSIWSDTWNFSTGELTDITEINVEQIELYPIPTTDVLMIDGIEGEIVTVSILSVEGRLIRQLHGYGIKKIEFYDLQKGIYIVRISNSKILHTEKIMKL